MAVREIVVEDEARLRIVSVPVVEWDGELHTLLNDLADTMHHFHGVGLAAPQVGVLLRVVVIDIGQGVLELINPEIIAQEGEQTGVESCLSFPTVVLEVKRPARLTVTAFNRNAERVQIQAEGLLARVLSHEIDHLNGALFFDRLSEDDMIAQMFQQVFGFEDAEEDEAGFDGGDLDLGTADLEIEGAADPNESYTDRPMSDGGTLDFEQDAQLSLDMMAEAAWKLQLGVELLRDYESAMDVVGEQLDALEELSERATQLLEVIEEKMTELRDGNSG